MSSGLHVLIGFEPSDEWSASEIEDYSRRLIRHASTVITPEHEISRAEVFELSIQDPRHDVGPRWLVDLWLGDDVTAPDKALDLTSREPVHPPLSGSAGRPKATVSWRLCLERRRLFGQMPDEVAEMFMIGVDVRPGGSGADLEELREFHASIHVPEVMAHVRYPAAATHARIGIDRATGPMPNVIGTYFADSAIATQARDTMYRLSGSPDQGLFEVGPASWQRRVSLWRIHYRPIATSRQAD